MSLPLSKQNKYFESKVKEKKIWILKRVHRLNSQIVKKKISTSILSDETIPFRMIEFEIHSFFNASTHTFSELFQQKRNFFSHS